MKPLKGILYIVFLPVNILMAALFLLSAYSSYISPEKYPLLSCAGLIFPFFLVVNIGFILFWVVFHYRYAIFSLIAIIICIPQIRTYFPINLRCGDVPSGRIKLLSYNVMGFDNMKRVNGENPILQYLAKSNADIICLQEYAVSSSEKDKYVNQKYVNEMMKSYPYRDVSPVGNRYSGNKLALFSRFPIISARRIPYESDYNGSVYYELVIEGDTVALINNHLESNKLTLKDREKYENFIDSLRTGKVHAENRSLIYKFAEASVTRAMQARAIERVINRIPYHNMIVCGDFNDGPLSYAHQIISQHLTDAFTQSGRGFGVSFNRNKFYFRIDNILVSSNMKSYNCTVDSSIKSSDHYPIWCYLLIKSFT